MPNYAYWDAIQPALDFSRLIRVSNIRPDVTANLFLEMRNHYPISHVRLQGRPIVSSDESRFFWIESPDSAQTTPHEQRITDLLVHYPISPEINGCIIANSGTLIVVAHNGYVVAGTTERLIARVGRMNPGDVLTFFDMATINEANRILDSGYLTQE